MESKVKRLNAIEWGIALGLVVGMCLVILPIADDDFTRVFWRIARGWGPIPPSTYWYPFWNTWMLRPLGALPCNVGLVLIWAFSVVVVLKLTPVWGTPAWVVLLCPVFIVCLGYGQPFEAVVFVGLTLVAIAGKQWEIAAGIVLLLFKPQVGFLPAVLACWWALRRRWWVVLAVPVIMAVISGDWWVVALRESGGVGWNNAPRLGIMSLFWLVPGAWLIVRFKNNLKQQLWVATLFSFLLVPYWTFYSLWPLAAMAGCWNNCLFDISVQTEKSVCLSE